MCSPNCEQANFERAVLQRWKFVIFFCARSIFTFIKSTPLSQGGNERIKSSFSFHWKVFKHSIHFWNFRTNPARATITLNYCLQNILCTSKGNFDQQKPKPLKWLHSLHVLLSILKCWLNIDGQINWIEWTDRQTHCVWRTNASLNKYVQVFQPFLPIIQKRNKNRLDSFNVHLIRERCEYKAKIAKAYPEWRWRKMKTNSNQQHSTKTKRKKLCTSTKCIPLSLCVHVHDRLRTERKSDLIFFFSWTFSSAFVVISCCSRSYHVCFEQFFAIAMSNDPWTNFYFFRRLS